MASPQLYAFECLWLWRADALAGVPWRGFQDVIVLAGLFWFVRVCLNVIWGVESPCGLWLCRSRAVVTACAAFPYNTTLSSLSLHLTLMG